MKEPNNLTNRNKTLIMAKLKPEDIEINKIIKESFEDPLDYLKVNSKVVIGNK